MTVGTSATNDNGPRGNDHDGRDSDGDGSRPRDVGKPPVNPGRRRLWPLRSGTGEPGMVPVDRIFFPSHSRHRAGSVPPVFACLHVGGRSR